MTKEDIERKCLEYSQAATPSYINGDFDRYAIAQAYEDGAIWRINSVWHDASEIPEKGRPLLEFCRGTRCGEFYEIGGRVSIKNQEWDDFYKFAGIVYWAYIDELIPERKEEKK